MKNPQAIASAVHDAATVVSDGQSTPVEKAEAGHMLCPWRDGGRKGCRGTCETERIIASRRTTPPGVSAEAAWKELTDPGSYYLPCRARPAGGKTLWGVLDLLAEAAALFPKEAGALLARRSTLRLEPGP